MHNSLLIFVLCVFADGFSYSLFIVFPAALLASSDSPDSLYINIQCISHSWHRVDILQHVTRCWRHTLPFTRRTRSLFEFHDCGAWVNTITYIVHRLVNWIWVWVWVHLAAPSTAAVTETETVANATSASCSWVWLAGWYSAMAVWLASLYAFWSLFTALDKRNADNVCLSRFVFRYFSFILFSFIFFLLPALWCESNSAFMCPIGQPDHTHTHTYTLPHTHNKYYKFQLATCVLLLLLLLFLKSSNSCKCKLNLFFCFSYWNRFPNRARAALVVLSYNSLLLKLSSTAIKLTA